MSNRQTGTFESYDKATQTGEILPEGGGDTLLFHYTDIIKDGYRSLKRGESVSFVGVRTSRGYGASEIRGEDDGDPSDEADWGEQIWHGKVMNVNDEIEGD
ncbi:cold shock domain-containing protein [Pseudomonas poae]|uniref:Cold shock domain-containing protein n=1 Tax=Pseudomonas poae TaxID=200451 RepID=A0A7M1KLH8_9PSED|nr:cold shock domain-containing protein [Pseudomonas poae]QOQ77085.1 cold shock domain-containing protein [Pseudomonas poae]